MNDMLAAKIVGVAVIWLGVFLILLNRDVGVAYMVVITLLAFKDELQ